MFGNKQLYTGKKSTIKETMDLKELKVDGYMGGSEGRREGGNYVIILSSQSSFLYGWG